MLKPTCAPERNWHARPRWGLTWSPCCWVLWQRRKNQTRLITGIHSLAARLGGIATADRRITATRHPKAANARYGTKREEAKRRRWGHMHLRPTRSAAPGARRRRRRDANVIGERKTDKKTPWKPTGRSPWIGFRRQQSKTYNPPAARTKERACARMSAHEPEVAEMQRCT